MNDRVLKYFNAIADKLEAGHNITATSKNSSDIGFSREKLVQDFLANHLASRLSPILGGHIFGFNQADSKQIDVIILNDIGLNFKENQKPFTPVENIAAAFTVKSRLDSNNLIDSLENIASIPQIDSEILKFNSLHPNSFNIFIKYHPVFFVFAYEGMTLESTLSTITEFYTKNEQIPLNRRPCGIVVNKKFYIRYNPEETNTLTGEIIPPYVFGGMQLDKEFQGYPFFHIFNCINFYSEWLLSMSIDYTKYFNTTIIKLGK